MADEPPAGGLASLVGPSTRITRRVDIYEEDAATSFMLDAPMLDGTVSVDGSRDERRTLDMLFDNRDGALDNYPGGFWYDKVLKIYRGLTWDGTSPSWIRFDATNQLQTTDSSVHTMTGNVLRIRTRMKRADWTTGVINTIVSKSIQSTNQRSWEFDFWDTGVLLVRLSTNGTNQLDLFITIPGTGVWPNGSTQYLGVDIQIDNGAGGKTATFITSVDGVTWTELGSSTSTALGTTPLFDNTAPLVIGARGDGTNRLASGDEMYFLQVYDDTRPMVDLDFTVLEAGQSGMQDVNGTAFTFSNGVSKVQGGTFEEQSWETQVGEFILDRIDTQNFPHTTKVTGRDYTKKLMESKFGYATTFAAGQRVEDVIEDIALNGNITKYILPYTGSTLGRDFTFEAETTRWEAIKQIAEAYGYDVYFDAQGYLVMQVFQDPISSPVAYTFETGEYGNLAAYGKSATDTRIYNQVIVRGEATDTIPYAAVAENHEPSSPTSIENLERTKTYIYTSPFITSEAQAQQLADNYLAVMALESFEVSLTSIVIPWLEALQIVEFLDPDPNPGDPSRFLLTNFDIPMKLGPMSAVAKRITVVG